MLYYARKKSNPEYKRCVKLFHFLKKGTFSTKKSVFCLCISPYCTQRNLKQLANAKHSKKEKNPPPPIVQYICQATVLLFSVCLVLWPCSYLLSSFCQFLPRFLSIYSIYCCIYSIPYLSSISFILSIVCSSLFVLSVLGYFYSCIIYTHMYIVDSSFLST